MRKGKRRKQLSELKPEWESQCPGEEELLGRELQEKGLLSSALLQGGQQGPASGDAVSSAGPVGVAQVP